MTNIAILIYSYTILEKISYICSFFLTIICILLPILYFSFCVVKEEFVNINLLIKHKKPFYMLFFSMVFLLLIIPNEGDLKRIIGGTIVVESIRGASEIEGIENLPQNLVDAANVFLEGLKDGEISKNDRDLGE